MVEEQKIIHTFDPSYLAEKVHELHFKYRWKLLAMILMWGMFFVLTGLLFAGKAVGRIGDDGFWGLFFIILGLLAFLKGLLFLLFHQGRK